MLISTEKKLFAFFQKEQKKKMGKRKSESESEQQQHFRLFFVHINMIIILMKIFHIRNYFQSVLLKHVS